MRLIPPTDGNNPATSEAYQQAFKHVHATVLTLIPREEHATLFVDYILTEHMLCKFSRSYHRLETVR